MRNPFLAIGAIASILSINGAIAAGENTVTSKSYVDAQDALKQDKITAKTSGNVVTYNGTGANGQAQFDERGIFDYDTGWDDQNGQLVEGHEDDLITAGDVIPNINNLNGTVNNLYNDVTNQITNVNNLHNDVTNQITNVNNNIADVAAALSSQNVPKISVQLPLICANEECNLWTVTGNSVVHRIQTCSSINDCPACETGFLKTCTGGKRTKYCGCVYGGCNTVADCPACGTGTKAACENNICKCNACKADGMTATNSAECCSGIIGDKTNRCCGTPGSGVSCPTK